MVVLPYRLAGTSIEGPKSRFFAERSQEHQISRDNGRSRRAELSFRDRQRFLPEFLAVWVVAQKAVRSEVDVHALAVRCRRRRCGRVGTKDLLDFVGGRVLPPANLAVGAI